MNNTTNSNGKISDALPSLPTSSADMPSKFEKYVDQVASVAHQNIDKLSDATHPALDRVASTAHSAVDAMGDTASQTVDALSKTGNTIAQKASQLKEIQQRNVESARSHVRDSPLMAVGIAAALGFLAARVLGRR